VESILPLGLVTFLLTDVEASTRIWRDSPQAAAVMARQSELIAAAIARHGGLRPADQGEGDSLLAAFALPSAALAAALEAQRALASEAWPASESVRVRMALHTGEAELRDERNYGGLALIRAARLRALARGGQVLVSQATAVLAGDELPDGASFADLGSVALQGLARPERVLQLCHPDLPAVVGDIHRPASLPVWTTPLIGRERERLEVVAIFAESRIVTITGAGGSGKTRLAHAVAQDLVERFADGVAWVELARLATEELVAGAVLAACGFREAPGVRALDMLAHSLAEREMLIVLDNCEHVLAACSAVTNAAMGAGTGVRVLATSREPLGVSGETSWRVPSLALPEPDERDFERIGEADAIRLFVARARAARPALQLDATSAPTIAHICRRLDGIPLALELASARVRVLSLERLAAGLDDRFRLLTGGARTASARQRTLLASVEWSHDLLDEEERLLFRRLAVFAAPFGLEAAEAVAGDDDLDRFSVFDVLARLVDKSLVQHVDESYRLLETLRQYALERAADAGELAELRDRHLAWFRRRADAWRLGQELATDALLTEVAAEVPDLLAALEWSLGSAQTVALELLPPLMQHWAFRDAVGEARALAARVLDALATFADGLVLAGDVAWQPAAQRALDMMGPEIGVGTQAFFEYALGLSSVFAGRADGADALRRAVEAGRNAGNRRIEILATVNLAYFLCVSGDVDHTRPLLVWLDRHLPAECAVSFLHEGAAAAAAMWLGDFGGARSRLERALRRGVRLGLLVYAGEIGFYTRDAAALRNALMRVKDRPAGWAVAEFSKSYLEAMLRLLSDELEEAARELDRSARDGSVIFAEHRMNVLRAEIDLSLGDSSGAATRVKEAERRLAGTDIPMVRAGADLLWAHLARVRGDVGEAETRAHQALANAWSHQMSLVVVDALETLAVLDIDRGAAAESARLLGAADAFRERTGYRWQAAHHRRAVDEARAELDCAGLAEGAALTLEDAVAYARRGRGTRGRPDHGWASLTPTELRVVELVAEGLPNREVAQRLFVSPATVKTHLLHVFTKLHVRTRAELAAATQRRFANAPNGGKTG